MKQQLPLLDISVNNEQNFDKAKSTNEDLITYNNQIESKNKNFLKQKFSIRNVKFPISETKEMESNHLKLMKRNLSSNQVFYNDIKDVKQVFTNEEKNNLIGVSAKIGSSNGIVASNQYALLKLEKHEEKKKKIEEVNKKKKDKKESKTFHKIRLKLEKVVDHNFFVIFFMILTVFIMFIGDIESGWLPAKSDDPIDILQTIILIIFTSEIIINCLAKEAYTLYFFFWLDVVSTISIIQDISFIFDPLLSIGSDVSNA